MLIKRERVPGKVRKMLFESGSSLRRWWTAGRIALCRHSALHEFDAYTVWRRDVAQQAAVYALLQLDGKGYAFAAQLVAEACEIALV